MFKKPESDEGREPPIMGTSDAKPVRGGGGDAATIGPTICIRGDLLGDEDLVVQGRIEGTVKLEKNLFTILKDHGFNWARLRIFVDPSAEGGYSKKSFCDLSHTLEMAKRIKAADMGFLLDFHYSDTWADPGHQNKPSKWADLHGAELEGFDAAERPRLEVGEAITEVGVVLEPSADVLTVTSESPLLAAQELPSSTHQDVDAGNRRLETLRAEAEALRSQLKRLPRASASRFDREVAGESAGDRPGGSGGYVSRIGPRAPVPPSTGGTVEPNDRPYGDMFFQAYGTNPFVDN